MCFLPYLWLNKCNIEEHKRLYMYICICICVFACEIRHFLLLELAKLKRMLPEMVRYEPTWEDLELLKDGGVAIIDQWICAHARYWITLFVNNKAVPEWHSFLCFRWTKAALSTVERWISYSILVRVSCCSTSWDFSFFFISFIDFNFSLSMLFLEG